MSLSCRRFASPMRASLTRIRYKEKQKGNTMKKFKKSNSNELVAQSTPIADKIIQLEEVVKIRLAVYDNAARTPHEITTGRYVAEVDLMFKDDRNNVWLSNDIKLRNNLSKIENIKYKLPADWGFTEQWYKTAFTAAEDWAKAQTAPVLHAKLGRRDTVMGKNQIEKRYLNIAGTLVSVALENPPRMLLQLADINLDLGDTAEAFSKGLADEFVLEEATETKNGMKLYYASFSEDQVDG